MDSLHDLELLIESGKRLIIVETQQEGCFLNGFKRIAKHSQQMFFQWTVTQGLLRLAPGYKAQSMNKDINHLFAQIKNTSSESVYILVDFHPFLADPIAVRHIKDCLAENLNHVLVLLSQKIDLPQELEAFVTRYELPLPTIEELKSMVADEARDFYKTHNLAVVRSDDKILLRLIDNLCGLSLVDAKRLAHHAIFNDGIINQQDIADIAKEKFKLLNQDSVLNLHLEHEELDKIAGFDNLKQWLKQREPIFNQETQLEGVDIPKGMLLLGVQGCGKSMAAKAVSGSWHLPLLHLDFAALYNRFYGQTEENLRDALKTAEMMAPCVLWLDEIEKGMSAVSASDDVSKRMLGTFLTWLAEKKQRVFVVATANDVSALPPELLRKGRFDEVFFVDLPTQEQREEILTIHLQRRNLLNDEVDITDIASKTKGFSGAELEQLVVSAIYAGSSSKQQINTKLLLEQANATKPLSILMNEKVEALREWAKQRTVSV